MAHVLHLTQRALLQLKAHWDKRVEPLWCYAGDPLPHEQVPLGGTGCCLTAVLASFQDLTAPCGTEEEPSGQQLSELRRATERNIMRLLYVR